MASVGDGEVDENVLPSAATYRANDETEEPGFELYTPRGNPDNFVLSDTDSIPFEPEPTGVVLNGSQGSHSGLFSPLHSGVGSDIDIELRSQPSQAGDAQPINSDALTRNIGVVAPHVCIKHGYYKVEKMQSANHVTVLETGETCSCPKEEKHMTGEETMLQKRSVIVSEDKDRPVSEPSRIPESNGVRDPAAVNGGKREPFNVGKFQEMSTFFRNFKFVMPTSDEEECTKQTGASVEDTRRQASNGSIQNLSSSRGASPATSVTYLGDSEVGAVVRQSRPETLGSQVTEKGQISSPSGRQELAGVSHSGDRGRSSSFSSAGSRISARSGLSGAHYRGSSHASSRSSLSSRHDVVGNQDGDLPLSGGRVSPIGNGVISSAPSSPPSIASVRSDAGSRSEASIKSTESKRSQPSRDLLKTSSVDHKSVTSQGSSSSVHRQAGLTYENLQIVKSGQSRSPSELSQRSNSTLKGDGSARSSLVSSGTRGSRQEVNSETGVLETVADLAVGDDRSTPRSQVSVGGLSGRLSNTADSVASSGMRSKASEKLLKQYQDKWLSMFQQMERQHQQQMAALNHEHQVNIQQLQVQIEQQLSQQHQLIEEKLGLSPKKDQSPDGDDDSAVVTSPPPGQGGEVRQEATGIEAGDKGSQGSLVVSRQMDQQSLLGKRSNAIGGAGEPAGGLRFGFGESQKILQEDAGNTDGGQGEGDAGMDNQKQIDTLTSGHITGGIGDNWVVSDVFSHDSSVEITDGDSKYPVIQTNFDLETPVMKALRLNKKHSPTTGKRKPLQATNSKPSDWPTLTRDDVAKVIQSVDEYLYRSTQNTKPKSDHASGVNKNVWPSEEEADPARDPPGPSGEQVERECGEGEHHSRPGSPGSSMSTSYQLLPEPSADTVRAVQNTSKEIADKFPTPTKSEIEASEQLRTELQQRHEAAVDVSPRTVESTYTSPLEGLQNVSNSRVNLREKHQRHLADLRAYYELEMEDLKAKISSPDYIKSRSPYKQLERENTRWQDRCNLLESELLKSKQYIGEMEGQLESMEMRVREYPKRLETAQDKITTLQYQLEQLTTYSSEKDVLVHKLESKNKDLSARLEEAYKLQDLKLANASKDAALLKKVQSQHDKLVTEHEKMKAALLTAENEIYDSRTQLAEYKRTVANLHLEQKRLSRENDLLRHRGLSTTLGRHDHESRQRAVMLSESQATYRAHQISPRTAMSQGNHSDTYMLKTETDRRLHNVDVESVDSRSDVDSEDRPLSPLLKAEREFERRLQTLEESTPKGASSSSYKDTNKRSQVLKVSDSYTVDRKQADVDSDSSAVGSEVSKRTPRKRKLKKDKSSLKYVVRQSPSGTVEMSVEVPNKDGHSPANNQETGVGHKDAPNATRFDVAAGTKKTPKEGAGVLPPNESSASVRSKADRVNGYVDGVRSGRYSSSPALPEGGTVSAQRARQARSKLSETKQMDPGTKLNERMQLVHDLERRLDELLVEKRTTESQLSHVGRSSSRENRKRKETLESHLDSIDKELGSIRMALKRNHVLKTNI